MEELKTDKKTTLRRTDSTLQASKMGQEGGKFNVYYRHAVVVNMMLFYFLLIQNQVSQSKIIMPPPHQVPDRPPSPPLKLEEALKTAKRLETAIAEAKRHLALASFSSKHGRNVNRQETERWIPKTSARFCPEGHSMKWKSTKSRQFKPHHRSQFKEDQTLMQWFGELCGGTCMEMGALDGMRWSNAWAFNKGLNWQGLLLEASPENFEGLQTNRPNELALVHAGVCEKEQDLHFVCGKNGDTGGFLEFVSETHKKKWFKQSAIDNAVVVKCQSLGKTIQEHLGEQVYFDFYSLDIEGAEYSALA